MEWREVCFPGLSDAKCWSFCRRESSTAAGGRDDGKGTRVRRARMSGRMTLIDSVAPFGFVFLLPVRESGATNRLPGGWNGYKVRAPCALPPRVRFWVGSCLSVDKINLYI